MGSVRARGRAAWKAHGRDLVGVFAGIPDVSGRGGPRPGTKSALEFCVGGTVSDLAYIGLTVVVFAVLYLILKGVERFER
jgi:hypothetical protein